VAVLLAMAIAPTQAHKPITSKYTYNADVYPIFRARCGSCHAAGGVAPMSLLKYQDAVPWAESIREELLDEKMPPWYVEPGGAGVKGALAISPKEIDTIVTWATGGTPEGQSASRPPATPASQDGWPSGTPDVEIAMAADYAMPADQTETVHDVVLPTGFTSNRWIALADLRPGAPDLVRDATIAVEHGPVLAVWTPGDRPERTPAGTAFEVPAGARLLLRIHYKKPWEDERKARVDRSRVGLYFAAGNPAPRAMQTLSIASSAASASAPGAEAASQMASALPTAASLVSIRPQLDQPYAELDVHAVLPSGARVPLLRLHRPRPEWNRRYWLDTPVDLAAGSRIEVHATPAPIDPDEPQYARTGTLQVALDYVAPTTSPR
jgi:hypothetical protein